MVAHGAAHAVRRDCARLEIAEPRVVTTLLQGRVPATERIHRDYNEGPKKIDERQGEPPPRRLGDGKVGYVARLKHPVDVSITRSTNDDGEQMDEKEMQQVVKHRHFSDDECGT